MWASIKSRLRQRILISRLRRRGMRIADDCRIIGGDTDFGSEPYLIEIGRHVTISFGCAFITHDGGTWVFRERPRYQGVTRFAPIRIRDNCFIGARSIILPGVTIGPDAVVGAGSVVTHDVPPGMVFAGNPARPICTVEEYAERCLRDSPQPPLPTDATQLHEALEALHGTNRQNC